MVVQGYKWSSCMATLMDLLTSDHLGDGCYQLKSNLFKPWIPVATSQGAWRGSFPIHPLHHTFFLLIRKRNIWRKVGIFGTRTHDRQLFQINARFELEREDVRQSVRGEFSAALEGLTQERSNLLNQLSDMRLKFAELQSEKETVERRWRLQAEQEAEKIHSK